MRAIVVFGLALAGCSTVGIKPPRAADITTVLKSAQGADKGTAVLRLADGRMQLMVEAMGLTPGARAVHIHNVGKCDPPDFMTAGPHWNPTGRQHGRDNLMGAHHGDLPNLLIGTDGRGSFSIDVPGTIAQLLDADGAAVMIHAQPDDYKTDPTGNAGGRVACGVLTAP